MSLVYVKQVPVVLTKLEYREIMRNLTFPEVINGEPNAPVSMGGYKSRSPRYFYK